MEIKIQIPSAEESYMETSSKYAIH